MIHPGTFGKSTRPAWLNYSVSSMCVGDNSKPMFSQLKCMCSTGVRKPVGSVSIWMGHRNWPSTSLSTSNNPQVKFPIFFGCNNHSLFHCMLLYLVYYHHSFIYLHKLSALMSRFKISLTAVEKTVQRDVWKRQPSICWQARGKVHHQLIQTISDKTHRVSQIDNGRSSR